MSDGYYDPRHSNGHSTSAGPPISPSDPYHNAPLSAGTGARSITPLDSRERDIKPDVNGLQGQGNGAVAGQLARKKLASWVGFSNLPNQVHRKSVR